MKTTPNTVIDLRMKLEAAAMRSESKYWLSESEEKTFNRFKSAFIAYELKSINGCPVVIINNIEPTEMELIASELCK